MIKYILEDSFKLPIIYKGEERELDAQLISYGYSHRFDVDIEGVTVLFEPDEERNYRVMLDNEALAKGEKVNVELIKLVGEKVQELFGR